MQTQFEQHIKSQFPFLKGKKILLTISGGIDSVVLAYLCKDAGLDFAMAHCNFRLRGKESDADEAFVEALAKEMEVELFIKPFDTEKFATENKMSIQVAARKLRYDWFAELAEDHGIDFIFTAHHANDSLETFLINTIRGTGLEGLTGIPEQNEQILRPLLAFSRKEIRAYAEKERISWREDSSNASTKYERNKIRHQVIPIFEDENPNLLNSFRKTQQHLQDTSDLLQEYTAVLFNEIVQEIGGSLHFDIQKIQEKSNPKAVLYQLLKAYEFTAWKDILALLTAQSGKMVFSPGYRLLKDRKTLILTAVVSEGAENQEIEISERTKQIEFPLGKLIFEDTETFGKAGKSQIYVNKHLIKFPLKLRKWKESDYFYPFGMNGKKKVSRYFKDEKFSLVEKEDAWLLVSDERILWIIGHRADERFRVKSGTSDLTAIHFVK